MPADMATDIVSARPSTQILSERAVRKLPQGLCHPTAIIIMIIWYISSGTTLFINKYTLSHLNGDALLLGLSQLVVSAISSYIQIQIMNAMPTQSQRPSPMLKHMCRDMLLIGAFRCLTVILGLYALKSIAASFLATIKSSSPLFTVITSRIILGEHTGYRTKLSMIPISLGLGLCSSFELSFQMLGFVCALGTNIFECLQNVYSKKLMNGETYRYTAIELQFWASLLGCIAQLMLTCYDMNISSVIESTSGSMMILYLLNGLSYHFQSVSAFGLMTYISPVTHSVVNTVKRGVLIWLSVVIFGNPVTFLSGFGTLLVVAGVLLYNEGRKGDANSDAPMSDTPLLVAWRDT